MKKNMLRVMLLLFVLGALLCTTAMAADNTIASIDELATGVTVTGYEDNVNFKLSYNQPTSGMYLVLVLRDELGSDLPLASDILYVDQANAGSSGVTFEKVYPSEIEADESYIYLAGTGLSAPIKLGKIVPNKAAAADLTVTVVGKGADMPTYTVNDRTVAVTYGVPCKLGYLNSDGTYVAIAGTESTGGYSYTVPEDINEVLVVVKGDLTGDGKVNNSDYGRLNAVLLKKYTKSTAAAIFAADITDDGKVNNSDYGRLNAVLLKKTPMKWK